MWFISKLESTTGHTFTPYVGYFTSSRIIRHQIDGTDRFSCLLRKTLAKSGKRNCQSSDAKCCQQDSNPGLLGRHSFAQTTATGPAHVKHFLDNENITNQEVLGRVLLMKECLLTDVRSTTIFVITSGTEHFSMHYSEGK